MPHRTRLVVALSAPEWHESECREQRRGPLEQGRCSRRSNSYNEFHLVAFEWFRAVHIFIIYLSETRFFHPKSNLNEMMNDIYMAKWPRFSMVCIVSCNCARDSIDLKTLLRSIAQIRNQSWYATRTLEIGAVYQSVKIMTELWIIYQMEIQVRISSVHNSNVVHCGCKCMIYYWKTNFATDVQKLIEFKHIDVMSIRWSIAYNAWQPSKCRPFMQMVWTICPTCSWSNLWIFSYL